MGLEQKQYSRHEILNEGVLPHGPRFMFLESAKIVEPGRLARGKLVDRRLPEFSYLADHFPGYPIFPGALSLEALAELAGLPIIQMAGTTQNKVGVLRKVIEMEWKQPITPEDVIDLEAEVTAFRLNTGRAKVKAIKDGKIAVEGEIVFMIGDKPKQT